MIQNPGMEAEWQNDHTVIVLPENKSRQIGNIFTPPEWLVWFLESYEFVQPEGHDARARDPDRMRTGEKGYLLFTFYKRHECGLLQAVEVERGARYKFTGWAHAWSNHDFGHMDDPRWSDGAGYEQIAWREGTQPETGDPQQDAKSNFVFDVGIDPFGGTDPFAARVVWGDGWHIYNGFVRQLEVEVEAKGEIITVFARSCTKWAFKHNDAYWDDFAVERVGELPPGTCRGHPREEYRRVSVLLPQSVLASSRGALAVIADKAGAWSDTKSADDAGVGDLDERVVVAIDPKRWPGNLEEFFAEHYPGVDYRAAAFDIPNIGYMVPSPYTLFQMAGRLRAADLQDKGVKFLNPSSHSPPKITGAFGDDRGDFVHNGVDLRGSWIVYSDEAQAAIGGEVMRAGEYINEPWYGTQIRIKSILPDGRVLYTRYAHLKALPYVVPGSHVMAGEILGMINNTGNSTGDHLHFDVKLDGGGYVDPAMLIDFEIEPEDVKLALPTVHLQTEVKNWLSYLARVRPKWVELVGGFELARAVKDATQGETKVLIRHVQNDWKQYVEHRDPAGNIDHKTAAESYLDEFWEAVVRIPEIDAVSDLNEYVNSTLSAAQLGAAWAVTFSDTVKEWSNWWDDREVGAVLLRVPVGNPDFGAQIRALIPVAEAAVRNDHWISYHGYMPSHGYDKTLEWLTSQFRYHHGRFIGDGHPAEKGYDEEFRAAGFRPRYLCTEWGVIGTGLRMDGQPGGYNAGAGWRWPETLNGNIEQYAFLLTRLRDLILKSPAGDRVDACCVFTTGDPGVIGWEHFTVWAEDWAVIANALGY